MALGFPDGLDTLSGLATTMAEPRAAIGARLEQRTRLMQPARRLRFELVLEMIDGIDAGRPLRVLDAGAGEGLLAMTLARQHSDWQIVAADVDDVMLDRGRRRAEDEGLRNLEFIRTDLTEDLGSEEFDVVLAVECLSEIPDDDAALRTMARALRTGGRFIAHVPHRDWMPVLPGALAPGGSRSATATVLRSSLRS